MNPWKSVWGVKKDHPPGCRFRLGRPGLDGPSPVAANAEGQFWGHRTRVEAEMCIALQPIHPVALLFTENQSHIPHILP
jgi:hypothetical protein